MDKEEEKPIRFKKSTSKKRNCLKCNKEFNSGGVWNRLCTNCAGRYSIPIQYLPS